ncbi:MAG: RNA methyltransferase, partial [Pseudomonadota bacterium]
RFQPRANSSATHALIRQALQGSAYTLVTSVAIEQITSPSNPRVKALRALERKKNRAETGLFLAEGPRLVQQGLERGWHLKTLAVAQDSLNRPHIIDLVSAARLANAHVFSVPDRIMSKIARKENPNAVVGAFTQQFSALDDLISDGNGIWIALYQVRDPGNLGTIVRTADCAGVSGVILVETCCDPFSLEAVRASMGSLFDIRLAQSSTEALFRWQQTQKVAFVGASMNGTIRHDAAPFGERVVLFMGNEQSGLPNDVEAQCDALIRIPMRGGADSLNLAQATAILTYEAWRQKGYDGAAP